MCSPKSFQTTDVSEKKNEINIKNNFHIALTKSEKNIFSFVVDHGNPRGSIFHISHSTA